MEVILVRTEINPYTGELGKCVKLEKEHRRTQEHILLWSSNDLELHPASKYPMDAVCAMLLIICTYEEVQLGLMLHLCSNWKWLERCLRTWLMEPDSSCNNINYKPVSFVSTIRGSPICICRKAFHVFYSIMRDNDCRVCYAGRKSASVQYRQYSKQMCAKCSNP